MTIEYFKTAEFVTYNVISVAAQIEDLNKKGVLDNYKYNKVTGKLELKTTLDTDVFNRDQLIQLAVESYVKKLSTIPLKDLKLLKSFESRLSVQSSAANAGTLLKADAVVIEALKNIYNQNPSVLGVAKELLEQEADLLKRQSALFTDFNDFKENFLKGFTAPSKFQNFSEFLEQVQKEPSLVDHLTPGERRVLANLVASDTELLDLEKRANYIARKTILPEIQKIRQAISSLGHNPKLQKELEFDQKLGELQSLMNMQNLSFAEFTRELKSLNNTLFENPASLHKLDRNEQVALKHVRALLPLLRQLNELVKKHNVVTNEFPLLQEIVNLAEIIDQHQKLEETLRDHHLSLQQFLEAIPAIHSAIAQTNPLAGLKTLKLEHQKCLKALPYAENSIRTLYELTKNDPKNGKEKISMLNNLILEIEMVIRNETSNATKLILKESLKEADNGYTSVELTNILTAANSLTELSEFLPYPDLVTTSQQLYYRTATELLKKNDFNKAMEVLSRAATVASFAPNHPISTIEQQIKATCPTDHSAALGLYVSGQDSSSVKERAIHAAIKKFEDGTSLCFDLKFNRHAREEMHGWNANIIKNPAEWKKGLPKGVQASMALSEPNEEYLYPERDEHGVFSSTSGSQLPQTPSIKIQFQGIGEVTMCPDKSKRSLYDWVNVKMPAGLPAAESARRLHLMLTLVGCPPSVVSSLDIDRQRQEIMELYRAWYPADAFDLEKSSPWFSLSIEALKKQILIRTPQMQMRFDKLNEEEGCRFKETFPGKQVPAMEMSDEMRKAGAFGLIIGMDRLNAPRIGQILKEGFLSCQQRFSAGIIATGASNYKDHIEGGADCVFTRLVTSRIAREIPANKMSFGQQVQIIVDLDAADSGNAYGYTYDAYGTRIDDTYAKRKNLIELTRDLEAQHTKKTEKDALVPDPNYGKANEIMIRDAIPANLIRGILVQSEEHKNLIVKELKQQGLVDYRSEGLYVFGKPLDRFIQVGNAFKKEMWDV